MDRLMWIIRGPVLQPLNLGENLSAQKKAEARWKYYKPLVDHRLFIMRALALSVIGGELAFIYFRGFKKGNGLISYLAIESLNRDSTLEDFLNQRRAISLYYTPEERSQDLITQQAYNMARNDRIRILNESLLARQLYNKICAPIVNHVRQIFNF